MLGVSTMPVPGSCSLQQGTDLHKGDCTGGIPEQSWGLSQPPREVPALPPDAVKERAGARQGHGGCFLVQD